MRIARALAVGGIAIATATAAMPFSSAEAATASQSTAQSWDQAGPYRDKPSCEFWRDYYATFYITDPCYQGPNSPNWYFLYCCI